MSHTEPLPDQSDPMDRCDCMIPYLEGAGQHAPGCSVFDPPEQWNVASDGSGISHRSLDPAASDQERAND